MAKVKELAIYGLQIVAIGVLVGAGVRAAEWAIPAPEMRVIVCLGNEVEKVETCATLKELVAKHGG